MRFLLGRIHRWYMEHTEGPMLVCHLVMVLGTVVIAQSTSPTCLLLLDVQS